MGRVKEDTMVQIGDTVINLNTKGVVIGFHEKTGDPILESGEGMRWVADEEKCEILREGTRHRDGLITFE